MYYTTTNPNILVHEVMQDHVISPTVLLGLQVVTTDSGSDMRALGLRGTRSGRCGVDQEYYVLYGPLGIVFIMG